MILTLTALLLYLTAVLAIGILASRFSSKNLEHYFLADRSLGPFVVALSTVASGRSAWMLLGYSGMAFALGVSALWATVGYIAAEAVLFVTVGRRLRNATQSQGDITLADFFASRFPKYALPLRLISALTMIVFLTTYVSAQFLGAGKTLQSSFGLSMEWGIAITAAIVLFYTILGGFLAVAITDVVQGLMMVGALIGVPLYVIFQTGGFSEMLQKLSAIDTGLLDPANIAGMMLIGFVGIGLGSVGNPHILVRYMSAKKESDLKRAAVIGTAANILMAVGATLTGLIARALYVSADRLPSGDKENVLPYLAQQHLHPFVFGLILAAIFAAIMSTCDSQLLVSASSVVRDLYQKIFRRGETISDRALVSLSRATIFILTALASIGAVGKWDFVFSFVLLAWAGLGATFGPALLFSLYWRKTHPAALIAGMVTGGATVAIWKLVPGVQSYFDNLYELVPAFFLSCLVIWVGSLLANSNKPPDSRPRP